MVNLKKIAKEEEALERKRGKALRKNVKRRKGKYTTSKDMELMFGY